MPDTSLIEWSRAQFALTAMYHWLFVPLTLGLGFLIAFMETLYVKTGDEEWKKATKFWMTLFGVNFAFGVATGIILEFQFGTNWSNYSWFVGDIFGSPLAVEGILAFFLETTFIAVMFFGWNKVSKRFHLVSTWLTAIGANLSALWILVANGWMQFPAGMHFNPETARNEMVNFWDVLFSPVAINKFLHTISSGFVLASVFVTGISAWFILRKREVIFARKSMVVAGVFGIITSIYLIFTGDGSARLIAHKQPVKFAAMEGLVDGKSGAPLTVFGVVSRKQQPADVKAKIEVPSLLSFLSFRNANAYVPGLKDFINGNPEHGVMSATEKMERGRKARQMFRDLREAKASNNTAEYEKLKATFTDQKFLDEYFRYFGYSFINNPSDLIPSVPLSFNSFRIMVYLGFYFVLLFVVVLVSLFTNKIVNRKWLLWLAVISIPLPYIAGQAGWIVAEVGRQPWAIQDYLPLSAAISHIDSSAVLVTFWIFAALFTAMIVAEVRILTRQIKIGPKKEEKI
ncbi:MAG TPA: cytochrome ubiquinol oxidase subunit I [Bacteroidales bacterium]|nr:cytochrome ubiquinol oxidase subunit I [Bacteroidales bacterium]